MNIQHFQHHDLDFQDSHDVAIDFNEGTYDQRTQSPSQNNNEEFRSTQDVMNNQRGNIGTNRFFIRLYLILCLKRISLCISKSIKFMCNRKFSFLLLFLIISQLLRVSQHFSARFIFWTTYFPMIIIVVAGVFRACVYIQRSREEFESTVNQRRTVFNDRLLRQIIMHNVENRLQIAVAMDARRSGLQNLQASIQAIQNQRNWIRQILFELGTMEENGFFARQNHNFGNRNQGLTEDEIAELPMEEYTQKGEPETCSICIDEFETGMNLRVLPCSHRYHGKCIDDWLKISNTCPNCKAEIPKSVEPALPNLFQRNFRIESP